MSKKVVLLVAAVAFATGTIAAVAAAEAAPAEQLKIRHEHFEALGDAFKAVRDNSRGGSPDWAALEKAAAVVQKASVDIKGWFPKGTGPEAGKTRALPVIWEKPDDFAAAQQMFAERAPKLSAAVKAKNAAAVQGAFKELGGACKNCHDTFRKPEE